MLHHVDVDRLRTAYWAIRPQAAPGSDGVTWVAYGQELEANLADQTALAPTCSQRTLTDLDLVADMTHR
ncbi:MAG: hypothetical protein WCG47_14320, partial [Dermatophilaceae bacterium]